MVVLEGLCVFVVFVTGLFHSPASSVYVPWNTKSGAQWNISVHCYHSNKCSWSYQNGVSAKWVCVMFLV